MPNRALADFNAFLYRSIPVVRFMQLQLISCTDTQLIAQAPAEPNRNDKQTIFGGSSAALMTVCGWSLIKFNLEQAGVLNDVVIGRSEIKWQRAQSDDLIISAESDINWPELIETINQGRIQPKIAVRNQVHNTQNQLGTDMSADFVILRKTPND